MSLRCGACGSDKVHIPGRGWLCSRGCAAPPSPRAIVFIDEVGRAEPTFADSKWPDDAVFARYEVPDCGKTGHDLGVKLAEEMVRDVRVCFHDECKELSDDRGQGATCVCLIHASEIFLRGLAKAPN